MATQTPNLSLKKPAGTDYVLVGDFNGNADALDATIGKMSELTTAVKTSLVLAINEANDRGTHPPYIGENNHWYEWDSATTQYVDSGVVAVNAINDAEMLGGVPASGYAKEINGQAAFTDIADTDYVPMYDTSATVQKKTLWSNIKAVLKTYFDTLYQVSIGTASGLLKGNGSGTISAATAGTDYQAAITASGLLKGAGSGSVSAATNGTDYIASVADDTTPQLGGELDANAHSIGCAEYDNGNSGTSKEIDWKKGNHQKVTMTGNCTFTFTAPTKACMLSLRIIQDSTGSRTVTLPTMKKPGGTAFTFSTEANAIDILSIYYDGSAYYGQAGIAFS